MGQVFEAITEFSLDDFFCGWHCSNKVSPQLVRKAIARNLTIANEKKRDALKNAFKSRKALREFNKANNTTYSLNKKPVELRPKLTKALRHQLTKHQKKLRTQRRITKECNFPQRRFAITA